MKKESEFKMIPIGNLEVVVDNPNEMTKDKMEHLRKTIKERGFMQVITVTPKEGIPGRYVVIDGAHRLEGYKALGNKTIPCWVVYDKKQVDIKIDLVNLNQTRGEFNDKKYAKLVKSLDHELGEEKLKELINIEEEEHKAYLALADGKIDNLEGAKKEVSFSVKDIKCPKCGHQAPKADFKIKKEK